MDMAQKDRIVAAYPTYLEAEQAVEQLTKANFPVEHVTIMGRGMRMVEQVTGKVTWIDNVIRGMLTGALVGVLVGWLFGVFDWFNPVVSAFWLAVDGLWFGAVVGSLFGFIMWLFMRGRGDFASVGGLQAERYELHVDEDFADQAERILSGAPTTPAGAPGGAGADTTPTAAASGRR
jgi:uncharacterized membrane protein